MVALPSLKITPLVDVNAAMTCHFALMREELECLIKTSSLIRHVRRLQIQSRRNGSCKSFRYNALVRHNCFNGPLTQNAIVGIVKTSCKRAIVRIPMLALSPFSPAGLSLGQSTRAQTGS